METQDFLVTNIEKYQKGSERFSKAQWITSFGTVGLFFAQAFAAIGAHGTNLGTSDFYLGLIISTAVTTLGGTISAGILNWKSNDLRLLANDLIHEYNKNAEGRSL